MKELRRRQLNAGWSIRWSVPRLGVICYCAVGSWGSRRPSLVPYVTVTGAKGGSPPPEGVHVAYPLGNGFTTGMVLHVDGGHRLVW